MNRWNQKRENRYVWTKSEGWSSQRTCHFGRGSGKGHPHAYSLHCFSQQRAHLLFLATLGLHPGYGHPSATTNVHLPSATFYY